jgi:hypothetical protein
MIKRRQGLISSLQGDLGVASFCFFIGPAVCYSKNPNFNSAFNQTKIIIIKVGKKCVNIIKST